MPKRNDLEQKALHYVVGTGYQGVLQSDLWRELGASSREGSRVSIKLEEKGLIRREKELQEGRWTYRLYPKRLPASIETIIDCPCLLCPDNARCDPTTTISPKSCRLVLGGAWRFPWICLLNRFGIHGLLPRRR
ncbi:MAG: transcriptional regulator [Chloroflexi bacterium]|nr:transcriptional regulator [Chloroflexota bacterium]